MRYRAGGRREAVRVRTKKRTHCAYAMRPMMNLRHREMKRPWERIMLAYVRGEIELGQTITAAQLRDRFFIHHGEELQIDLAFVRAPFRLVKVGQGPFTVRAA